MPRLIKQANTTRSTKAARIICEGEAILTNNISLAPMDSNVNDVNKGSLSVKHGQTTS